MLLYLVHVSAIMHEHTTHIDRYNNLICHCGKIFVRNITVLPDYVEYRTDADRDI